MSTQAKIYQGTRVESFWEPVIRPWFEKALANSWQETSPTVVLCPSRSFGSELRRRLLENNLGCAGVYFWTASDCRTHLRQLFGDQALVATRENLHLLLAISAEAHSTLPIAQAVARDPSNLMSAIDLLEDARMGLAALSLKELEPVLESFRLLIQRCGIKRVQEVDDWLEKKSRIPRETRGLGPVLIAGFDAGHWPSWNLLNAAVRTSSAPTICLSLPRFRAERLDHAWVGSWEEAWGDLEPILEEDTQPHSHFSMLAEGLEGSPTPGTSLDKSQARICIRIGRHVREEALAIMGQAVQYLHDSQCTHLGILFPSCGALSREVASLLKENGISHWDGLGQVPVKAATEELWQAWLNLQKNPRLPTLHQFLRAAPTAFHGFGLSWERLQRILERAFSEILVDDLKVLVEFLRASDKEEERWVAEHLAAWNHLPESATLGDFLHLTRRDLERLHLDQNLETLVRGASSFLLKLQDPIPRATYIAWMAEATSRLLTSRAADGNHPYARVELLPYHLAEGRSWSHLILTSLNEGQWPPAVEDGGFIREEEIQKLNSQAITQGRHGEGHVIAFDGQGLLLGPVERRHLLQKQFFNLLESVEHSICATAALQHESAPEIHLGPSEFLARIHLAQEGQPLSEEVLVRMREETALWLAATLLVVPPPLNPQTANATLKAYQARRNPGYAFGEYEFCLRKAPSSPITLSCKEWEEALLQPATAWLKHVLRVEPSRTSTAEDIWPITRGTWVHRWLGYAADHEGRGGWVGFPKAATLMKDVREAALKTQRAVHQAFEKAGKPMPMWWQAGWRESLWLSESLATQLAGIDTWPFLASEWEIPENIKLHESGLILRGRMDLVLASSIPAEDNKSSTRLWVLDFKTGPTKPLAASQLEKGIGVQAALYSLVWHARGYSQVEASLVVPSRPLQPELELSEILQTSGLWNELGRMQETGIFGMREKLRDEYGARETRLPLATLEIEQEILEEKWTRTHPALGGLT